MLTSIAIFLVVSADETQAAHADQKLTLSKSAQQAKDFPPDENSATNQLEDLFHDEAAPTKKADDPEVVSLTDPEEGGSLPMLHNSLIAAHSSLGDVLHMGLASPIEADSPPEHSALVAAKFTKMLEMFAVMHKIVKPVRRELEATLEHLPVGKARYHTEFLLNHVSDLDRQSRTVSALLQNLKEADGDEAKKAAIAKLITGVVTMKDELFDNLASLKEAIHPVSGKVSPFMKMRVVLHKLAKKIKHELTDPKMKDSKTVKLDVRMYTTLKTAISKAETLIAAGTLALKREPSKHMEAAIHRVLKRRMAVVTADLRSEMNKIKMERDAASHAEKSKMHESSEKSEESAESEASEKSDKSEESEKSEKSDKSDKSEKQLRQHGLPLPDPAVDE